MTAHLPSAQVHCAACPIRHNAVCAKCETAELEKLEKIKYYRTFSVGETIAMTGDEIDFVASVVRGVATLGHTLEDGRTQMLGLLLPSDFIGRPGRDRIAYDVTAVSNVTLCCFRKKPFEKMLDETPNIGKRLLEMTMDELDAAREWMLILGRKTAREKIASLLAIIARRNSADPGTNPDARKVIDLPLTREAMANYLGLTLETVSRQMSALKRDNVILLDGNRRVIVPDMSHLLRETGDYAAIA